MNKNIITLSIFVLITSCESEKTGVIQETDIHPDKVITSMIQYPFTWEDVERNNIKVFGGSGPDSIVHFAVALLELDLNNDNHKDFDLGVRHSYQDIELGQQDEFMIYIGSWDYNEVSLSHVDSAYIRKYNIGEEFDLNSFSASSRVSLNYPGGFLIKKDTEDNFVNEGEYYVGVRIKVNGNAHYGWILVETKFLTLIAKEFAFCNVPGVRIKAGQRD